MKSKVVIIGGLDPGGGAGVLADGRVMEAMALPYCTVVTALTAQTDKKFFGYQACSPQMFRRQLRACGKNCRGVKIGMLGDTRLITPLIQWLNRVRPKVVIWDPVIRSSSGGKLINAGRWNQALEALLARVTLWTPNIPEARWILGRDITSSREMEEAAKDLWKMGKARPHWVLLKGGHRKGKNQPVVDYLTDGKNTHAFRSRRLPKSPRGTGCTLASALLAHLSQGVPMRDAVRLSKAYLVASIF